MKNLILALSVLLSSSAFAADRRPIDVITAGGIYQTYSYRCGLEVEKNGDELIVTDIDNSLLREPCVARGGIARFQCRSDQYCERTFPSAPNRIFVELLTDGNFLILGQGDPAKFMLQ